LAGKHRIYRANLAPQLASVKDWPVNAPNDPWGRVKGLVHGAAFRERSPIGHSVLPVESAVLSEWLDVQKNVRLIEQQGV